MTFDIRPCSLSVVADLCRAHHGYGGAGGSATYAFAVYEGQRPVAAYAWQPPAPGAAKSVCPQEPGGVLALSRMVAVPREERALKHISKPLKYQMARLIDRGRWPALVTYSDEGQGHTGYVYKCSGWKPTLRSSTPTWTDAAGKRTSSYSGGRCRTEHLTRGPDTIIQRWEHWITPPEHVANHMTLAGWMREAIPGKVWRSGRPAHRWVKHVWV